VGHITPFIFFSEHIGLKWRVFGEFSFVKYCNRPPLIPTYCYRSWILIGNMDPSQELYRGIKATSMITVILGTHSSCFILHTLEDSYKLNTQQLLSAISYITALTVTTVATTSSLSLNSSHTHTHTQKLRCSLSFVRRCNRMSENTPVTEPTTRQQRQLPHCNKLTTAAHEILPTTATPPITCPQLTFEASLATVCEAASYNI
jgi:hypothetical protein